MSLWDKKNPASRGRFDQIRNFRKHPPNVDYGGLGIYMKDIQSTRDVPNWGYIQADKWGCSMTENNPWGDGDEISPSWIIH